MKVKPLGALVCSVLILLMPVISDFQTPITHQMQAADSIEDYLNIQVLSDPELNGSYLTSQNDNHNAFAANSLTSEVELLWTHQDGVELDFRETYDYTMNLPDCEEYVYVSESFDWDYNVLPEIVEVNFVYGLYLAGDFDSITFPNLFSVYVWIIDSAGEWTQLGKSLNNMPSSAVHSTIHVSYQSVTRAWGGTIENVFGVQTDPTDTLTFAVYAFANHENQYWNWMNGAVQVIVDSMELHCVVNPTPDEINTLEPDFVRTSGGNFDDICSDIAITEEGSIYTIGSIFSKPEFMTLTKWTTTGAVSWRHAIQGENSWRGFGIAVSETDIVGVGLAAVDNDTNTIIAKWNHQGQLLWNKTVDMGEYDYGYKVDIGYDGSIIVVGTLLGEFAPIVYLAKFSSDGNLLWSTNCGDLINDYPKDIAVAYDGFIYASTFRGASKWNFDGIQVWNITGVFRTVKVTRDGNFYTTNLFPPSNILQQWHNNGTMGWNITLTYNHTYAGVVYQHPTLIGVTPAGWVYVLLSSAQGIGNFILAIFDTEGILLLNQTVNSEYLGHPYYVMNNIVAAVHSSGFVCFAPSILTVTGNLDLCLQLYLTDRAPPIISTPITVVIIVVAAVIMIAIPLDYIRRRRSFIEEEEVFDWGFNSSLFGFASTAT